MQPLLDALAEWQVLDRSYDGTRAANLAEYRNRHYVYQFTQAGYRAYRAVEDVLGASLEDAQLSRLVFPDILGDLHALAEANTAGDGEEVYRKLGRLDSVLNEMAQRAARFYLMLGDLARTNDTRPEVFLAHKDTLLAHMREFTAELGRYAPLLAEAVEKAAATGVDRMIEYAAEADERLFRSPAERLADWRHRWDGIVHWFAEREHSETERLQDATVTAIRSVLALLRRVTEARRGGVSRESQLRHLAAVVHLLRERRGRARPVPGGLRARRAPTHRRPVRRSRADPGAYVLVGGRAGRTRPHPRPVRPHPRPARPRPHRTRRRPAGACCAPSSSRSRPSAVAPRTPSRRTACTAGRSTSPRRGPCSPCSTWRSPPASPPAARSPPPPAPPTGYGSPSPPPRASPPSTPCAAVSISTGCAWRSPHERRPLV